MVLFLLKFFSRPSGWPSPFRCTASTWEGFSNQSPPGSDLAMKCFNQSINQSLTWDFQINLLQVQILLWNVLTIPISEYCTLPHLLSFWLSSGLTSRGKYFFLQKKLFCQPVSNPSFRGAIVAELTVVANYPPINRWPPRSLIFTKIHGILSSLKARLKVGI